MTYDSLEKGFLEPIADLSHEQIEEACEKAVGNAKDLLEEADILRSAGRCARAYFLAHIACEELGKIPIFVATAVSETVGLPVNWDRIDKVLRSHTTKIAQVLFMDSIVGDKGLAEGEAAYEADLKRMRSYTDTKNASLYSSYSAGKFAGPGEIISCQFFDAFRPLAHGRLKAFEEMYLGPVRRAGGLAAFAGKSASPRVKAVIEAVTGAEGREAFEDYKATGDDIKIRSLFDRLINSAGPKDS
jgi:AbiV family abortive infection protein